MSDLQFTVSGGAAPLSVSMGGGNQAASFQMIQNDDVLLTLVEGCVARNFRITEDYERNEYVIKDHAIYQYIVDHAAGDWDPDEVENIPLAEGLVRILNEECFAIDTGVISALPKVIVDVRVDESCIVEDKILDDQVTIGWVTVGGSLILYGDLPSGRTLESRKLAIRRCHGMTRDAIKATIKFEIGDATNGNALVATAENLIPNVSYTWKLYTSDGTMVYSVNKVTSKPTYSMRYEEAARGLVNGNYYVTVAPAGNSSLMATSAAVAFTKRLS